MMTPAFALTPQESIYSQVYRGDLSLVDQLSAEWLRLWESQATPLPFCRPDFVRAYLESFEPNARLVIVVVRRGRELCALLPLVEEKVWFGGLPVLRLRGAAGVHSFRFDALTNGDSVSLVALWRGLRDIHNWNVVELPYISSPTAAHDLLTYASHDRYRTGWWNAGPGGIVDLVEPGVPQPWLQKVGRKLRAKIRRSRERLEQDGGLRLVTAKIVDEKSLQTIFDLEASAWKASAGSAIISSPTTKHFYTELLRIAGEKGFLRCHTLMHRDRAIAVSVGLQSRRRYFGLKSGYDTTYQSFSPGYLLISMIMDECAVNGFDSVDFSAPAVGWKLDWKPKFYRFGYGYVFRGSAYGALLRFQKFRLIPALRRILRRSDASDHFGTEEQ